jgi:hypothetical protein
MVSEQITSPFILQKTKEAPQVDNNYIDDLSKILRLMQKSKLGFFSLQMFFILKQRYPQEYLSLLSEQNPALYEKEILEKQKIEKEKAEKEANMNKTANIKQDKKEYEKWVAYYGNP